MSEWLLETSIDRIEDDDMQMIAVSVRDENEARGSHVDADWVGRLRGLAQFAHELACKYLFLLVFKGVFIERSILLNDSFS